MHKGRLVGVVALVASAFVVTGCNVVSRTTAENKSAVPVVVHVSWYSAGRYVVLRPGSSMVVDIVRAPRAPASSIDILGVDCLVITHVAGEFRDGGVVTVHEDGTTTFVPGQHDSGTAAGLDEANEFSTCAEAVADAGN